LQLALWFDKSIALDPKRAIAYINLGDPWFNLNRKANAKKAYQKYPELAPNSTKALKIIERLANLQSPL
jgi:hypothetical protein